MMKIKILFTAFCMMTLKAILQDIAVSNNDSHSFSPFGTVCAYVFVVLILHMTDVDFIRLSALVFATRLIGKTKDPISEGTEMAERLLNKLKEKED